VRPNSAEKWEWSTGRTAVNGPEERPQRASRIYAPARTAEIAPKHDTRLLKQPVSAVVTVY
jgi:hypothetical protein